MGGNLSPSSESGLYVVMNKTSPILRSVVLITCIGVALTVVSHLERSRSANLTQVSVTLSNPRPSFWGSLAAGNTSGSSAVIITTTAASYPSVNAGQLVEGDSVGIGDTNSIGVYTVGPTNDNTASTFGITSALATGDSDTGDLVISSQSATLAVRFITASAENNGKFRVLVPALTNDAQSQDGLPDSGYFDYTPTTPTVTCPNNVGNYSFGASSKAASSVTINGVDYHSFICPYTGTGTSGQSFVLNPMTISGLLNPAPVTATHVPGTADTNKIIVQQLRSDNSVADSTTVSIGVVEAVRVTANVSPQISFQIAGLSSGTSACGVSTGVTTTATLVPLGELSVGTFTNAAQNLTVSTNAPGGFSVTAQENDQLGRGGAVCLGDNTGTSCIRDSVGNGGTMTETTSAEWTNASTAPGFGYSLQDVGNNTTELFSYNESSRTFSAKQFADTENSQSAVEIFKSTAPATNENVYVCYRATIPATQEAGNYENYLTYTATSKF